MNFCKDDSASEYPIKIKNGDLIIVYERHDTLDHFYVQAGKIFNNKFGAFHHFDFIGKSYGTKIYSRDTQRWVYALKPSNEIWSQAVHTRTQIVDEIDCSIIVFYLDLYPGCVVVESGTGSGCMTLSFARTIAPNGHIHTYEYNSNRADLSRLEFERYGISFYVLYMYR